MLKEFGIFSGRLPSQMPNKFNRCKSSFPIKLFSSFGHCHNNLLSILVFNFSHNCGIGTTSPRRNKDMGLVKVDDYEKRYQTKTQEKCYDWSEA